MHAWNRGGEGGGKALGYDDRKVMVPYVSPQLHRILVRSGIADRLVALSLCPKAQALPELGLGVF